MHQSKILYMDSNTYVGDDKMILGQKDSRTLPFFGPFSCIFGILEYCIWNIRILEYWNIGILEYWNIGI